MRYFRQIVPQVFFRAGASILKWKKLWCQCGRSEITAGWGRRNTKRSDLQHFGARARLQDDTSTCSTVNVWLNLIPVTIDSRNRESNGGNVRLKSLTVVPRALQQTDIVGVPTQPRSPHAPVTQNINLLSPGCLFYPDLNSTLFLWRSDWVSGETVNKSKESITALLYTWKLSIF